MIQVRPLLVVDASSIAALLFNEPKADVVAARMEGCHLAAPDLLWFEVASVCLKKVRRYPDRIDTTLKAFGRLEALQITPVRIDHREVVDLAHRLDVTSYDASYVWLARRLDAPLETLDRLLRLNADET